MQPPADPAYVAEEATARINEVIPPQDQARYIARYLQILDAQVAHLLTVANLAPDAGLVSSEVAEKAFIRSRWDWARTIRQTEAQVRAALDAGQTIEKGDIAWPAPP